MIIENGKARAEKTGENNVKRGRPRSGKALQKEFLINSIKKKENLSAKLPLRWAAKRIW